MEKLMAKHWHHLPGAEVVDLLQSNSEGGLDEFEVKRRQEHFGPNIITGKGGRGPLMRLLLQFHQPLVYILLAAGVVTAALQEWVDSGVIFGVVLVNAGHGLARTVNAKRQCAVINAGKVSQRLLSR